MTLPQIEVADSYLSPQALLSALPEASRLLLESTLVHEKSRWAILAYEHSAQFYSQGGRSFLNSQELFGNPFSLLSQMMEESKCTSAHSELPFLGGWVGCVSYEAARFLEKVPTFQEDFDFLFYKIDSCYVFNLLEEKLYLLSSEGKIPELKKYLQTSSLRSPKYEDVKQSGDLLHNHPGIQSNLSREHYLEAIDRIQTYIKDGHSYQVNLSQRFTLENKAEALEIYKRLSQLNPVPFSGFFEWEGMTILSGSPERLFEVKDDKIRTRPIAGTRRCGSEEETARFIEELRKDPKEHAEHAMLVDLERNDLGRICNYGSVHVKEFMDIVVYKSIIHTESEVVGTLREDVNFVDMMRALFPGGTITGVPKIRTMEIIHELETCARGIYTGTMGYFSKCGHMDFNIMIRPILCKDEKAYTHAGGGITCKSKAEREFKETLHKARPQLLAILGANHE